MTRTATPLPENITQARAAKWNTRSLHQTRLKLLTSLRAEICGCTRCDDADQIPGLNITIQTTLERIQELTDQLSDSGKKPSTSSRGSGERSKEWPGA
jgi:hypothetical protein